MTNTIEKKMLEAITWNRNWTLGGTKVTYDAVKNCSYVYWTLGGVYAATVNYKGEDVSHLNTNHIATVNHDSHIFEFCFADTQVKAIAARLNALFTYLGSAVKYVPLTKENIDLYDVPECTYNDCLLVNTIDGSYTMVKIGKRYALDCHTNEITALQTL